MAVKKDLKLNPRRDQAQPMLKACVLTVAFRSRAAFKNKMKNFRNVPYATARFKTYIYVVKLIQKQERFWLEAVNRKYRKSLPK